VPADERSFRLLEVVRYAGRWRSAAARGRGLRWRLLAPLIFVAAGVMFVASAISSGGTDLRADRYDNLADLAKQQTERVQRLRDEVAALNAEDDRLSAGLAHHRGLSRLQAQVDALSGPAGLTPVAGPGVTVTLQDAPREIREAAGAQVSNAIVHQQDIQAVANALWKGGAEAMTLQGQRVVSTTGIKCVGNTVILHGVPYSPPYRISAIGDPAALRAALLRSPYIRAYLQAVSEWQLGWSVQMQTRILAPAFDGPVEMHYARPAAQPDGGT
jgi:uncharacterized protein YlxW (UPF0749 family)